MENRVGILKGPEGQVPCPSLGQGTCPLGPLYIPLKMKYIPTANKRMTRMISRMEIIKMIQPATFLPVTIKYIPNTIGPNKKPKIPQSHGFLLCFGASIAKYIAIIIDIINPKENSKNDPSQQMISIKEYGIFIKLCLIDDTKILTTTCDKIPHSYEL